MNAQNIFEGGLIYDGNLGDVGVLASVVGQCGKLKNAATTSVDDGGLGGSDWHSLVGGVSLEISDFEVASSIGEDSLGASPNCYQ